MKIAICAQGTGLESPVDERFGRAPYFVLVDEKGTVLESLENPAASSAQGAGISAAQALINRQVNAVLTGRVGPKAFRTLKAAKVKIYTGVAGTVKDTLEKYTRGQLSELETENSAPRHGGGS